jgi:hypothetical protein
MCLKKKVSMHTWPWFSHSCVKRDPHVFGHFNALVEKTEKVKYNPYVHLYLGLTNDAELKTKLQNFSKVNKRPFSDSGAHSTPSFPK